MPKQILIFSASLDDPTTKPVVDLLRHRGYTVLDYKADKVASGAVSFAITMDDKAGWFISYDEEPFNPDQVAAAWLRRPTLFRTLNLPTDRAAQSSVDAERRATQQFIEDLVPVSRWLNAPDILSRQEAGHKMDQLRLAREVGFHVPTTVISNHWATISPVLSPNVVYKSFWGRRNDAQRQYMVYTTPLQNAGSGAPPLEGLPYPGIWQDNLPKKHEWRVTVIGDRTFDAIIQHDSDHTKDDWRRHDMTKDTNVRWEHGEFPKIEKKKCFEYCKRSKLRMGMFDFIEDHDGKITFLECNPNGQYIWLEDRLGFPLSEAVADELVRIAQDCP